MQVAAEVRAQVHERENPGHTTFVNAISMPRQEVSGRKLSVLLVDDHTVMRKALATMLAQEPDLYVIGEAADGKQAVALACQLRPDVILMDIAMPEMDGIEATRAIRADCPAVQVVGLSMSQDVEQAKPMLEAGATGYVCKTESPDVLLAAIRRCATA
jgi:DNA-binding NarL/FixJ family response regulator